MSCVAELNEVVTGVPSTSTSEVGTKLAPVMITLADPLPLPVTAPAGFRLTMDGAGLPMSNSALVALLIVCGAAYRYRIGVEEAALRRRFGAAYVDYSQHTRRLIPWLY